MGPLGRGWTHNYNSSLLIGSFALTLFEGDGKGVSFAIDTSTMVVANDGTIFSAVFRPFDSHGDDSIITKMTNADGTYYYAHREKNGTVNNYDQNGKMTSVIDRTGKTTNLTYAGTNLTGITDPSGRTTTISYDTNNRISTISGPDPSSPKTVTFIYDPSAGNLVTVRDVLNHEWGYTYYPSGVTGDGMMNTKKDPNGNTMNYTYQSDGKVQTSIDLDGKIKTMTYYPSYNKATVTEKDGGVWTYVYDPTLFVPLTETNPKGETTTYTYYSNRKLHTKTDANNNATTYSYDTNNNLYQVQDALGNTTTYDQYDGFGQAGRITDPDNNVTLYYYDSTNGNLLTTTDPSGNLTTYGYWPTGTFNGSLKSITNAAGEKTSYDSYDQWNNATQITDAAGVVTTYIYDTNGNMTDQSVGGKTTHFDYTALDQLWKVTDPLGNIIEYTYDDNGNKHTVKEPKLPTETLDIITTYENNFMNQVTKVTDALGNITQYTYEGGGCSSCGGGSGRLTAVTDAESHTIGYEYDPLHNTGRLTKMTDQLGKTETYTYYQNDNLWTVTDRKGQTTTYTYNAVNQVTRIDYQDGSYTTYAYYAPTDNQKTGKIKTITDSVSGTITYTYTTTLDSPMPVGLVKTEATPQGSSTYGYDHTGRRTKMTVTGEPDVNYGYYTAARHNDITTTINGQAATFVIANDTVGRRASITYPNGVTTSYAAYDDANHLLTLRYLNPANAVLESLNYTYAPNGNRISMDRQNVNLPRPGAVTSTSYNAANQMLTFNAQTPNVTYDDNGNMTSVTNSCGTTNYTWDVRNRLIGIAGYKPDCSSLTASFVYDALGRRIEKTISGTTTDYLYDGKDIVQEIQNGIPTVNYIRTLNIDEPLARVELAANKVRYYHMDALGSVIGLSNESGQEVTQYAYDAFGQVSVSGEASDNPFQYTGRENDNTGLYYYRARYYSPELQRFISEDPILNPGNPRGYALPALLSYPMALHEFLYVGDNPINLNDPLGLFYNNTVVDYHCGCTKLLTAKERCICHCGYSGPESAKCEKDCMDCSSSTKPLSPVELCKCGCKAAGGQECDSICKKVTK